MRKYLPFVGLLIVLFSCSNTEQQKHAALPALNIDSSRVTVSGISSGAYLAGQMHVASSSVFNGLGMIAGGPYWCAGNSLTKALGPCVKGGDVEQDVISSHIEELATADRIDQTSHLVGDRVWLFHGSMDTAVDKRVTAAAKEFYKQFMATDQIAFVDTIDVVHGMPTLEAGAACDEFAEPYVNACDYDAAGEMLAHLYGPLNARKTDVGSLSRFDQSRFEDAELLDYGFLYTPADCEAGESCGLHVVFHGCQQSAQVIGDAFATQAGFNEWAETNQLVVLYPQVSSSKIAPMNPLGCWDWWGYTGEDYATRDGAQVSAVMSMIEQLTRGNPE